MQSFSLPLSNFKQLNFNNYARDFIFIYEHEAFPCNKIIADFLSPIVNKIHLTDPTLEQFEISNDEHYPPSFFNLIIECGELKDIQITKENVKALKYFFDKLGNNELLKFLFFHKSDQQDKNLTSKNSKDKVNQSSSLTIDSVFNMLSIKTQLGVSTDPEVDFIASHLFELENKMQTEKSVLTVDALRMIFSSPHICINNEEWLFDYIIKRANEDGKEFICLFEFVKFNQLSKESVEAFFNYVPLEEMNQSIYNSIIDLTMNSFKSSKDARNPNSSLSHRYHISPQEEKKKKEEDKKKEVSIKTIQNIFNFDGRHPLEGAFNFLTKTVSNGHNIATAGIIDITSSSINSNNNDSDLKHLVDFNPTTVFISNNEPNQWITFDFKNRKITPTCYTFITHRGNRGSDHLKNWVIEVSDDNIHYTVITTETNNVTLNSPGGIVVFRVSNPRQGRYVRIRQTGPNWWNSNILALAQVEFFGNLYEFEE